MRSMVEGSSAGAVYPSTIESPLNGSPPREPRLAGRNSSSLLLLLFPPLGELL